MAASTRAAYGMGGDLVYIDSAAERPKLFVSKKHGLSGRPDAVVMDGEHHIPVELKTGRVPRGPLFSHILQVVAYCVLLEDEYGGAPPSHQGARSAPGRPDASGASPVRTG